MVFPLHLAAQTSFSHLHTHPLPLQTESTWSLIHSRCVLNFLYNLITSTQHCTLDASFQLGDSHLIQRASCALLVRWVGCDLGHSPSPWLAPNPSASSHLQDVKMPERQSFSCFTLPHLPLRDIMRINGITDEMPPRKRAT